MVDLKLCMVMTAQNPDPPSLAIQAMTSLFFIAALCGKSTISLKHYGS
ncbi:MAG: hypothetical protein QXF26_01680 [Candidatus Bathyarchaeia archaeon]